MCSGLLKNLEDTERIRLPRLGDRSVAGALVHRRAHALAQFVGFVRKMRLNAARALETLFPITVVEVINADRATCRRRMHDLVIADINTDVRDGPAHGIEEDEVTRLQIAESHLLSHPAHFHSAPRQLETKRVLKD